MKHIYLAATISSLLALTACGSKNDASESTVPPSAASATASTANPEPTPMGQPATSTTPPVGEPAPMPEGGARASSGDDIALGMLAAVDEHEIAAAQQAKEKKASGAVLDYANMMEKEHSENLTQTKALGTLGDTPDIKAMKDKGAGDLATLGEKSGKVYETAYVDAMIAGHKDALAMIDGKMMASASTDKVRQHLSTTKEHVQAHLAKAEQIKQGM